MRRAIGLAVIDQAQPKMLFSQRWIIANIVCRKCFKPISNGVVKWQNANREQVEIRRHMRETEAIEMPTDDECVHKIHARTQNHRLELEY